MLLSKDSGRRPGKEGRGQDDCGGAPEVANCLRVLEGDVTLQAQCVEEDAAAMRRCSRRRRAPTRQRLLGAMDECFEDMIAAAKA